MVPVREAWGRDSIAPD